MYVWVFLHNKIGNFNTTPNVKPNAKLITTGPYAVVRHPMYLALLTSMAGFSVAYGDTYKFVAWAVLLVVLIAKISIEESALQIEFPEYVKYKRDTKMLIPLLI